MRKKSSDLLRHVKKLLGDKYTSFDQELFKQLYQYLPPTIQRNLFSVKSKLLMKLLTSLMSLWRLPVDTLSSVASIGTKVDTQLLPELVT